jgi:hypothetical protein
MLSGLYKYVNAMQFCILRRTWSCTKNLASDYDNCDLAFMNEINVKK